MYSDYLVSAVTFLSSSCMCRVLVCLRDVCRCPFAHEAQKSAGMGTQVVLSSWRPTHSVTCASLLHLPKRLGTSDETLVTNSSVRLASRTTSYTSNSAFQSETRSRSSFKGLLSGTDGAKDGSGFFGQQQLRTQVGEQRCGVRLPCWSRGRVCGVAPG